MSLEQGNWVRVDGQEAKIETSWGQGKHRMFKLSDGRLVADLDKLIASGIASQVEAPLERPMKKPSDPKKWTL